MEDFIPLNIQTEFLKARWRTLTSQQSKDFIVLGLAAGFTEQQVYIMLLPYLEPNEVDVPHIDMLETSEIVLLVQYLETRWKSHFWKDEDMIDFQTRVFSNPCNEGVMEVFKQHPMIDRLTRESGPSVSIGRGPSTFVLPNNNNNTCRVEFLDDEPDDDDEKPRDIYHIISVPQYSTPPTKARSTIYPLWVSVPEGGEFDVGDTFNYLRAFRSDENCVLTLILTSYNEETRWARQYLVRKNIWTIFSESPLPIDETYMAATLSSDSDVTLSLVGIKLSDKDERAHIERLRNNCVNYYHHGFTPSDIIE